jgi:hypothetical protein
MTTFLYAAYAARPLLQTAMTALAAALALAIAPSPAEAAPCAELPSPVYVTGGGRVLLENLGKVLSPAGVSLVYKLQGSCLALDAILNGTPMTGQATYWDATTALTCELDPAGNVADLGISDVFATTCLSLPSGLPANVGDIFGPVEAYAFVVPKASTQKSISKNAAYFVYGFGNGSGVAPWDDEAFIFQRDSASGTQQMMAAAIDVPPDRWRGTPVASSGDLVTALTTAAQAEKAIGILTTEVAGEHALSLNILAYQADEQTCAFWPDSTLTSRDKRNVRDGHYSIWGPIHLLTKLDGNGYPVNAGAADVIAYLTGTKPAPGGLDLIALLATTGLVPQCAMRVERHSELGPLMSHAPDRSCGCYYESLATGQSTCTACTTDIDCTEDTPRCNFGFCEVQ